MMCDCTLSEQEQLILDGIAGKPKVVRDRRAGHHAGAHADPKSGKRLHIHSLLLATTVV